MRSSTPSYTIKIVFPSNSFSRFRHSKNNWYHTICADLFPSGDLLQGVLKAVCFSIAIFFAAGGLLFLCSGDASLKNCLHSLILLCRKSEWSGGCVGHCCCDPDGNSGGNSTQDYIKLNTGLVNNFNNFNNIWNVLHICMEKYATVFVGSRVKAIILIIIFYWHLKPDADTIERWTHNPAGSSFSIFLPIIISGAKPVEILPDKVGLRFQLPSSLCELRRYKTDQQGGVLNV